MKLSNFRWENSTVIRLIDPALGLVSYSDDYYGAIN